MLALNTKKIALIGFGTISKTYLDVLSEIPAVSLTSIVDPNIHRLREFTSGPIKHYLTVADMLNHDLRPEVAIVCSPPNTHRNIVEQLAKSHVATLVEKPLSLTAEDSDRISALAIRYSTKISTSTTFRFAKSLQLMKNLIREGDIGHLKEVYCALTGIVDVTNNWRGNQEIAGGGVWMDNGPDALDIVETLAGFIRQIRMTKCLFEQNGRVEDAVEVECLHDNDVKSFISLSWNKQLDVPYAHCVGERGELKGEWNETVLIKDGIQQNICEGYDQKQAFKALLEHFITHAQVLDHGSEAIKWILAGYRSWESGQWETI